MPVGGRPILARPVMVGFLVLGRSAVLFPILVPVSLVIPLIILAAGPARPLPLVNLLLISTA